jgi:hypothetical protein
MIEIEPFIDLFMSLVVPSAQIEPLDPSEF